jgi:hypothetical protein
VAPRSSATAQSSEVFSDRHPNRRSGAGGIAKHGRGATTWISDDSFRRKPERNEISGPQADGQVLENDKKASQLQATPSTKVSRPTRPVYTSTDDAQVQVRNGESKVQRFVDGSLKGRYCDASRGRSYESTENNITAKGTPKESTVGASAFKRTINGNLIRIGIHDSGLVFDSRYADLLAG